MVIEVCIGSACHIKGSYGVISEIQSLIEKHSLSDKVILKAVFCLGNCVNAVSVRIGEEIFSVSPDTAEKFFNENVIAKI